MSWDIHKTTEFNHPPERVWQALTNKDALSKWLMRNDFEPKVGHKFRFTAKPAPGWDGVVECEVLELEENRRLVVSWWGRGKTPRTKVTWTLESLNGGKRTRLVMAHTGLVGMHGLMMKLGMSGGWKKMYGPGGSLAQVLDALQHERPLPTADWCKHAA